MHFLPFQKSFFLHSENRREKEREYKESAQFYAFTWMSFRDGKSVPECCRAKDIRVLPANAPLRNGMASSHIGTPPRWQSVVSSAPYGDNNNVKMPRTIGKTPSNRFRFPVLATRRGFRRRNDLISPFGAKEWLVRWAKRRYSVFDVLNRTSDTTGRWQELRKIGNVARKHLTCCRRHRRFGGS